MKLLRRITEDESDGLKGMVSAEHLRIAHEARTVGEHLAASGAGNDVVDAQVGAIAAAYDELAVRVREVTQGEISRSVGGISRAFWEREDASFEKGQGELSAGLSRLAMERDKIVLGYDWKSHWLKALLKWLIIAADAIGNGYSLTVTGGSLLSAFAVAAAFAVGLWVCATYVTGRITRIADRATRKRAWAAYAIGMTALFVGVAALRAVFVSLPSLPFMLGVCAWTLLNAFLFFAASVLSSTFPTHEQKRLKQKRDGYQSKISQLESEARVLARERADASERLQEQMEICSERILLEQHHSASISALAHSTIQAFRGQVGVGRAFGMRNSSASKTYGI